MGVLTPQTVTLKDGRRVWLRSAEEGDAAATLAFRRESARTSPYIATSAHEVPVEASVQAERIRQFRERAREVLVMGVDEAGAVVALAALTSPGRERLNHVVDAGISLGDGWRGSGLGRAVMQALIDWAGQQPGIIKMSLGVIPENAAAVALYRRLGFVEDGLQRAHFRREDGTFADHLLMALWVKPGHPSSGGERRRG